MVKQPERNDRVETAASVGESLQVLMFDETPQAGLGRGVACDLQHALRHIRAGHLVAQFRQMDHHPSSAARNIEHAMVLRDQRERAVDQPHLGAVLRRLAILVATR